MDEEAYLHARLHEIDMEAERQKKPLIDRLMEIKNMRAVSSAWVIVNPDGTISFRE